MSGKLFETKRMNFQEYTRGIINASSILNLNSIYVPKQLGNKTSFGDVDIFVIDTDDNRNNVISALMKHYKCESFEELNTLNSKKTIFKNILSANKQFMIEDIHYDIRFIKSFRDLEFIRRLYSYNDFQMFISKWCKSLNLVLKESGLYYNTNVIGEPNILITKDFYSVLSLLGLGDKEYFDDTCLQNNSISAGKRIESYQEMFSWMWRSEFFHPSFFKFKENDSRYDRESVKIFNEFCLDLNYNKDNDSRYDRESVKIFNEFCLDLNYNKDIVGTIHNNFKIKLFSAYPDLVKNIINNRSFTVEGLMQLNNMLDFID